MSDNNFASTFMSTAPPKIVGQVSPRDARISLNWSATLVYVLLHIGCLGVFYTGLDGRAIAVLSGVYLIRAIDVTLVYHRYFAHRTCRTARTMQFFLGLYGTMTVLGGPLWWAQTHR